MFGHSLLMTKQITVNGQPQRVLNSYSCGPGQVAHTYDIPGGHVYNIAGTWTLSRPGQWPLVVTVEV
jgi:hypothetical protein